MDGSADSDQLRDAALRFQESLQTAAPDPCQIPACARTHVRLTEEELGDSTRSADRIPHALRNLQPRTKKRPLQQGAMATKVCVRCGLPAHPSVSDDDDGISLCERCDFACFRCGRAASLGAGLDTVCCLACDLRWKANALGYTLSVVEAAKSLHGGALILNGAVDELVDLRYDGERLGDVGSNDVDDLEEDLSTEVIDHYQSLWTDRPPSPN